MDALPLRNGSKLSIQQMQGGTFFRFCAQLYGEITPNRARQCLLYALFGLMLDICHGICHMKAMTERHVKLFKNGRNQAVRIPREFELPGDDAIMHREGDRLIIEAAPAKSLLRILSELKPIEESFPDINDAAPDDVSL